MKRPAVRRLVRRWICHWLKLWWSILHLKTHWKLSTKLNFPRSLLSFAIISRTRLVVACIGRHELQCSHAAASECGRFCPRPHFAIGNEKVMSQVTTAYSYVWLSCAPPSASPPKHLADMATKLLGPAWCWLSLVSRRARSLILACIWHHWQVTWKCFFRRREQWAISVTYKCVENVATYFKGVVCSHQIKRICTFPI